MTDYNAITNTEIEPEKPVTSSLMTRLRDNPIAITEGASGAPQIQTAAIANAAITSAKLATGTGERDWVLARIAAASLGAVGTYAMLGQFGAAVNVNPGETRAGSFLAYTNAGAGNSGIQPSGTWRAMGLSESSSGTANSVTLWVRIS